MSKMTESGIKPIAMAMALASAGLVAAVPEGAALVLYLNHRTHFHLAEGNANPTARNSMTRVSRVLTDAKVFRSAANVNTAK